jgi:hypothetical protein
MMNIFRWSMVLPGAIVSAFLVLFPLHIALYQTLTGSGFIEPYPQSPERILSPFVAAIGFVWGGARIAPYRKSAAAIALFGGWLLLAGASLTLGILGTRFGNTQYSIQWGGLPFAGTIFGAAVGLYLAHRDAIALRPKPV